MGMQKRFGRAVEGQVMIEHDVKRLLQQAGVQPGLNHFYMAFAKKVVQISRKHIGITACRELELLVEKWTARDLNVNILRDIRDLYTSCAPAVSDPFLLDVSLLDGLDVLS